MSGKIEARNRLFKKKKVSVLMASSVGAFKKGVSVERKALGMHYKA